ncbi:hypothetical protein Pyn_04637 [Prunus yedoensis var. nudiflora]|uniref:Uncharacterized protein n=1 Tax=Prunus yedoensis var. nudiflora TaxID=2094558 RepID=A0A314YL67_PRUYE|nr:hypothetical protein Pyn_04637 [Prunus yedoensis var. nudiflora]
MARSDGGKEMGMYTGLKGALAPSNLCTLTPLGSLRVPPWYSLFAHALEPPNSSHTRAALTLCRGFYLQLCAGDCRYLFWLCGLF